MANEDILNSPALEKYKIDMYGASLLIIKAPKGFLACGYIKVETAEKLGQACVIVTGVKEYADMLTAKAVALSSKSAALGIKADESGADALAKLL